MTEEPVARGEQTRAMILQAAYQLMLEQGYHGTSMRQVAEKAGIALGGIYNHFSSKEQVFQAVLAEMNPYLFLFPAMNAAEGETIDEFVRDAFRRMIEVMGERYEFINLIFIELVEFDGKHLSALIDSVFPEGFQFIHRLNTLQGNLRPISPPLLLRSFMGTFFSYIMAERLVGSVMPPEMRKNAGETIIDIYLHGILAEA